MIGKLGKSASFLQEGLLELRSKRADLAGSIDAALIGLRANNAGRFLARRLSERIPNSAPRSSCATSQSLARTVAMPVKKS